MFAACCVLGFAALALPGICIKVLCAGRSVNLSFLARFVFSEFFCVGFSWCWEFTDLACCISFPTFYCLGSTFRLLPCLASGAGVRL